MAIQQAATKVQTKELIAALARDEELVVMPLKRYNAMLQTIEELRERLQDTKDAQILKDIDSDPNQHWRPFEEVQAQLIAEGLLDAA